MHDIGLLLSSPCSFPEVQHLRSRLWNATATSLPGRGLANLPRVSSGTLEALTLPDSGSLQLLHGAEQVVTAVAATLISVGILGGHDEQRPRRLASFSSNDSTAELGVDDVGSDAADEAWFRSAQAKLLDCSSLSGAELYRFVLGHTSHEGYAPSPTQIMWADVGATQAADIRALVLRAAAFPSLNFALIGAERLSTACREELLHVLTSAAGRDARLSLVLTAPTNPSFLSFIEQRVSIQPADVPLVADLRRRVTTLFPDVSEQTLFSDVAVVVGESGAGKTQAIKAELDSRVGGHWLRIAVHGSINVLALAAAYGDLVAGALAAQPPQGIAAAADSRPEVGLYFDVSAPAVECGSSGAAVVLHALLMHGLLLHAPSGTGVALNVHVRHAVFFELPALPAWPRPGSRDFNPLDHPFLREGLPVLGLVNTVGRAVHNGSVPFAVDAAARLVAPVLAAVLDGSPLNLFLRQSANEREAEGATVRSPSSAVSPRTLSDAEISALLERLWALPECRDVPTTKLARHALVRLLAVRVEYLHGLYAHTRGVLKSGFENPLVTAATVSKTHVFDSLARLFVLESIQLCDSSLRRNWADPAQPFVWSIRGRDFHSFSMLCLAQDVDAEALGAAPAAPPALGGLTANRATTAAEELRGLADLVTFRGMLAEQARGGSLLRLFLAPAFGIVGDTGRITRILSTAGYVLR